MSKTSVVMLNGAGQVTDVALFDDDLNMKVGDSWCSPSDKQFEIERVALADTTIVLIRRKNTDTLTGAGSRADFERDLDALFYQNVAFALGMCDINRLKQVNDKEGHLAGDALLKSFVENLQQNLRQGDTVYRYGGDEFVILFTQVQQARHLPAMQARLAPILGQCATMGIAHRTEVSSSTELIALADKRMYDAKKASLPKRP